MKDKKEISIEEFVLNYFGFSKNRITFDNEMVREIKIIKRVIPVVKGFLKEQHEKELKRIKEQIRIKGENALKHFKLQGIDNNEFTLRVTKLVTLEEENQKLKTKILGLEGENKELTEQNTQLLVKLKESK